MIARRLADGSRNSTSRLPEMHLPAGTVHWCGDAPRVMGVVARRLAKERKNGGTEAAAIDATEDAQRVLGRSDISAIVFSFITFNSPKHIVWYLIFFFFFTFFFFVIKHPSFIHGDLCQLPFEQTALVRPRVLFHRAQTDTHAQHDHSFDGRAAVGGGPGRHGPARSEGLLRGQGRRVLRRRLQRLYEVRRLLPSALS